MPFWPRRGREMEGAAGVRGLVLFRRPAGTRSRAPAQPGAPRKHVAHSSCRFRRQPHSLQSTWHPFRLAATKANANRVRFGGVLSVSFQSVCSSRHSFSCLIYFILKGLSICITRTGGEKVSDVYQVSLGLLFVIVRNNSPPSLAVLLIHPPLALPAPACLSLQVSAHQRYEFHVLGAFTLETYFVRLWQTLFYYPSNISLFTIWWLGNRTILLSNKINVPAIWQNILRWRGCALANACCILWASLQRDTKDAIYSSRWDCFMVPAALLFSVRVLIIAFSRHLAQLFLLLSAILAYK